MVVPVGNKYACFSGMLALKLVLSSLDLTLTFLTSIAAFTPTLYLSMADLFEVEVPVISV